MEHIQTLSPSFIVLLSLVSLSLALFFRRKLVALKTAEWIEKEGQFQRLPADQLEAAICDAKSRGIYEPFLTLLSLIRQKHGHDGVKIGHLYWIWHQIDTGDLDIALDTIPSFDKPSKVSGEEMNFKVVLNGGESGSVIFPSLSEAKQLHNYLNSDERHGLLPGVPEETLVDPTHESFVQWLESNG